MSMVSAVLRNEETRAGGRRTVAGIVNSVETLEGEGFLVRRPFPWLARTHYGRESCSLEWAGKGVKRGSCPAL